MARRLGFGPAGVCAVKTIKNVRQFARFNANTLICNFYATMIVFSVSTQNDVCFFRTVLDGVIKQYTDYFVQRRRFASHNYRL